MTEAEERAATESRERWQATRRRMEQALRARHAKHKREARRLIFSRAVDVGGVDDEGQAPFPERKTEPV
jgi:hypothetical protein